MDNLLSLTASEIAAVIRSRGVAAKQGFLMYYSKGDAIGDQGKCPLYRRSGRLSGVVVKRGSTVCQESEYATRLTYISTPKRRKRLCMSTETCTGAPIA